MVKACREEFELARENYQEILEIPFWGALAMDSFVVSGQSQIHGDSNIWISTTSSEPTFSFIAITRIREISLGHDKDFFDGCSVSVFPLLLIAFVIPSWGRNLHILLDSRSRWLQILLRPVCVGQSEKLSMLFAFTLQGNRATCVPDVTMKCELLAFANTQVRALDFKRNQRW